MGKIGLLRIKRLLRVAKGDISEYSLSEIYLINEKNRKLFLPNLIKQIANFNSDKFDIYLRKVFSNFYSLDYKDSTQF